METLPKLCPTPALEAGSFYPTTPPPTKTNQDKLFFGRNSCSRPKIGHFSTKNPPEIPLLEQQSLRKKREHQQAEQTLPLLPRIPSPQKEKNQAQIPGRMLNLVARKEEKRFYLPSSWESQKANKDLSAGPHTQTSSSGSKNKPQSQIGGEKEGRDPAGFGNPPASDKHAQFQQNLGKGRLGWSLPSPQPGSQRDGGVVVDLNQGKRRKNNK